jgi:hypothetical protein
MPTLNYFAQLLNQSQNSLPQAQANSDTLKSALTIFFAVLGALALLMIVVAGFRYIISAGDSNKTAEIKNQILYAFIGLIVAVSAAAIVNLLLGRL